MGATHLNRKKICQILVRFYAAEASAERLTAHEGVSEILGLLRKYLPG